MIEWRDVTRFCGWLVLFAAMELLTAAVGTGEPNADTAIAMAALFTILAAIRDTKEPNS